jgi:hypothetical protein
LGSEYPFTLSGQLSTLRQTRARLLRPVEGFADVADLGFVVAANATAASAERLGISRTVPGDGGDRGRDRA